MAPAPQRTVSGQTRAPVRPPPALGRRDVLLGAGVLGLGALTGCSALSLPGSGGAPGAATAPHGGAPGPLAVADPVRIDYGPAAQRQHGDLFLPAGIPADSALPVLVSVHGGGWRAASDLRYMEPLCWAVASHGVAVWNIEYHGTGAGGGWPRTFEDVAAAVDAVADLHRRAPVTVDLDRVHVTGHSAGGHLAAWIASRPGLPASAPGADPRVTVRSCLSMAGVLDLALAHRRGDHYIRPLLGGSPEEVPERYALASPVEILPTGVPVVCLHGTGDRTVHVEQAERYVEAARRAGDPAESVIVPGADHGSWVDTATPVWRTAHERIVRQVLGA